MDSIDRYIIEAVIGEGGMGRVYRALDPRLGRRVALKVLLADGAPGEAQDTAAARLLREARAVAAFNHPNVVAIYDVGETDGSPYIAMELVTGRSLRAYVGDANVTVEQKVAWLLDVARGLGAAHRAGLVHRDMKPENVMIAADGGVKILDFGIARHADTGPQGTTGVTAPELPALTGSGVVLGTLRYMAPEQIRAEPLDGRVDQFAWGIVAYELLAGELPWGHVTSGVSAVSAVLAKRARPLREWVPAVGAALSDAIDRALAKAPDERFASMEELVAAITGAPERARSAPVPVAREAAERDAHVSTRAAVTRTQRLVGRRSAAGAMLAAALALGALGIGAATKWAARSSPAPAPSSSATRAGCASNAECTRAADGRASLCRHADGACVELASEDCKPRATAAEIADEGTIWLGLMVPQSSVAGWFASDLRSIELAQSDFRLVGGLPARARDARTRPLALMLCDDAADAKRAAAHLVDLGVPAVMGFGELAEALDLSTNVFVPRHILVMNVTSPNPLVTRVAQPPGEPRLVWRVPSAMTERGKAVARLVTEYVEPSLRRAGGPLAGDAPLRVALVRTSDPNPRAFAETIVAELRMNGGPVVANADSFRAIVHGRELSPSEATAVTAEIAAFAPHVILMVSSGRFMASLLEPIERAWHAPYRPIYVANDILDGDALHRFVGKDAARRRRFLGVELPANTEANLDFVAHYNEVYTPHITPGTAPGAVYERVYVLAFAAASAPGELDGAAMAEGMRHIRRDGVRVSIGPSGILGAFAALRAGSALALDGAGTNLNLDPATGETPSDFAVYCLKNQPNGAVDSVESGLRVDHHTWHIAGTFRCE